MNARDQEPGRGYGNRRRYDAGYRPAHDTRYQRERRKPSRYQRRGTPSHQAIKEMVPDIRKLLEQSVEHNQKRLDAQTRWIDAEERSAAGLETIAGLLNRLFLSAASIPDK